MTWEDFTVDVYARFRDNLGSKAVEISTDYNKLVLWMSTWQNLKSLRL